MTSELPRVSRAFERAYAWFAAPRDSLPACAARLGLGATLLLAYLQYLPYAEVFFGPQGIGGHDTIARHAYFWGITYEWYARFRVLHLFESAVPMWILYGALLVSSAAFAAGVATRVAGVAAAVLHMIFYVHDPMLDGGWGALMGPWILYMALCECDGQLSVRARRARRSGQSLPTRAAPWGMRLLQVHLCVMYLVPGFARLDAEGWVRGEMVLRALMNVEYGRFEIGWQSASPALMVLTWAVLLLEPAAPFILWLRGVGRYWALLLIAMHTCLEILADTGWWQPMMVSALLTFLPARWIKKVAWTSPS
jgi:hypothetical protein